MNLQETTCWQHQVKQRNLQNDLVLAGLSESSSKEVKIKDLHFQFIDKLNIEMCRKIKAFVETHEWLGKMPSRPTQRFVATYKDQIVAVVVMATPYAFSYKFGRENAGLEKLIARGASISWAPKSTGSWLIMQSINWMVKNTKYRIFSGYSDTEAGELGTIYQACNFIYLGRNSGTKHLYFDPENPQRGWFNDRLFRKIGQYKKYARKIGYDWDPSWVKGFSMNWSMVPSSIHAQLAQASVKYRERCLKREVPRKHKYVLIKGKDRRETAGLLKHLYEVNPALKPSSKQSHPGLPYPKERGE